MDGDVPSGATCATASARLRVTHAVPSVPAATNDGNDWPGRANDSTVPSGEIRPTRSAVDSVTHTAPSSATAMPYGAEPSAMSN